MTGYTFGRVLTSRWHIETDLATLANRLPGHVFTPPGVNRIRAVSLLDETDPIDARVAHPSARADGWGHDDRVVTEARQTRIVFPSSRPHPLLLQRMGHPARSRLYPAGREPHQSRQPFRRNRPDRCLFLTRTSRGLQVNPPSRCRPLRGLSTGTQPSGSVPRVIDGSLIAQQDVEVGAAEQVGDGHG